MSHKIPDSQIVEEYKEFDSAGWTDDDEAVAAAVEFQRLPSRGFRGALTRYYWVCSLHSTQPESTRVSIFLSFFLVYITCSLARCPLLTLSPRLSQSFVVLPS